MKRGRPKGRSSDTRSFGPLGDLIRRYRMEKKMGLLEVAKACKCSVQFISNIEHGRAPLPWDKAEKLAKTLKIPFEELQAANLAIRSDFRSFMTVSGGTTGATKTTKSRKVAKASTALTGAKDAASLMAYTATDPQLKEIIQRYQGASQSQRKKFLAQAKKLLAEAAL